MSARGSPQGRSLLMDSAGYEWEEVGAADTPTDSENLLPPPSKPGVQVKGVGYQGSTASLHSAELSKWPIGTIQH